MSAGQQLAAARRAHQWSLERIAERLQVSVARIVALEATDVGRLPSRMYLKDLVVEYAREVGLNPQQVEERYLTEFDALVRGPHATSAVVVSPSPSESKPRGDAHEHPAQAAPAAPAHARRRVGQEPETDLLLYVPPRADAPDMAPAWYRRVRSLGYVAGAAAVLTAVGALFYLGGVDLVQTGADPGRIAERQREPVPPPDPPGGASQDPADVPLPAAPLRDETPPIATPDTRSDAQSSTSAPALPAPESTVRRARPVDSPPAPPTAGSAATDEPSAVDEPAASQAPDFSGVWYVTNRVEPAESSGNKTMTLGFQLTLEQRGTKVVGNGHKFYENGKLLNGRRRTTIVAEGHLDGERLVLNFTERGAARSAGRLVLHMADDGSLRGRFTSDASGSSGSSTAVRPRQGARRPATPT